MDSKQVYQKYIELVPIVKNSQKSLRKLATELSVSVNTLIRIKKAIADIESKASDSKKTIRFTALEIQHIEKRAKAQNLSFSEYVRACVFKKH